MIALNGTRPTSPVRVTINGQAEVFTRSHVRRISIYTGDGNDSVRIDEQNGTVPVSATRISAPATICTRAARDAISCRADRKKQLDGVAETTGSTAKAATTASPAAGC